MDQSDQIIRAQADDSSQMKLLAALAIVISLAIGQSNAATQYSATENIALFGWLDQYSMVPLGATACVPTSATNAMTFLQGANPAYSGTTLTGLNYSSWVSTTTTLMSSSYMDTTSANGTIYNHIPYALTKYITGDCGFSNVSFSGMFPADYWSDTYPKPSYMTDGLPSWAFLLSAIQTNQATIFSFSSGPGMGHESTAVGFSWLDANNDGIIQQSENATISFVDPLDPSAAYTGGLPDGTAKITTAQIWNAGDLAGGALNITYNQYAGSLPYTSDYGLYTGSIDTMFAIVPEPQTIAFLVLSLTCLPLAMGWKATRAANIRSGMRLRIAILILAVSGVGDLPSVHAESDYAVVASKATIQDPAWKKVADTLLQKHHGELVTYDGSVKQSLERLRTLHPLYTCFVAKPKSVTQQYVADIHQLTRKYNDDPFCDTFWGILTGYDAANALTIAQHNEPLTVRKVVANTDIAYEMVDEAIVYDELVQNKMIRKKPGKAPVIMKGPDDTTQAMVEALNNFAPDLIVSSSHATEGDWQLSFSYPNGQLKSKAGKMTGYDIDDNAFPVSSPNPKVYLPVGNCLMGHINNSNSMALAWMNSVGVYQMIGYTFETWYGYAGWGCLDYFVEQPGRYTLAEAFRANDCALIQRLLSYAPQAATMESKLSSNPEYHGKLTAQARQDGITRDDVEGLLFDRDVLAFYGDPEWDARMADAPKAWNQSLTESNGIYTFTVQANRGVKSFEPVNTNGSQRGGRPLVEFFPCRLKDFSLLEGADLKPVFADGFLLVPNPGTCDASGKYVVRFKANRMSD